MKKLIFLLQTFLSVALFLITGTNTYSQNETSARSMSDYFTRPMVEEAPRNIILQNRCGNRATLMFFEEYCDVQFVYKPNAYRRKEHRARNFSNRDNYTELFSQFRLPRLKESFVKTWGYDPFVTKLGLETPWEAKNNITVVNIADENAFAISAKAPLLIAIKPHSEFSVENGLLTEKFTDRGEDMVSFIKFNGFEENRYRVTTSGEYVLQLFENEVIIVGGEENEYQVERAVRNLEDYSLDELIARNERILEPKMDKGLVSFNNPDFQEVIDLNHRIVYSGMDEGGACFGALNRIYYLIWVRDGSMTSSLMARAGNPELIKTWTRFLLNNPSVITKDDGEKVAEFLQIVGSRWTKSEDDGIFYAVLSLFTYFQTTGQDDLLRGDEFQTLLTAIDYYIEKVWDAERKMTISDTRGETPLKSNPYFGYDVVNGDFERNDHHLTDEGKSISKSASLYNMVNTYNVMMMASSMLKQRDDLNNGRVERYQSIADDIQQSIKTKYVGPDGYLYSEYLQYSDGSDYWQPFAKGADYWEYTWAVSLGPFYPALDLQLKSARMGPDTWPKIRTYGYCPWNTLSRFLYEYGMSSEDYESMLTDQIDEALMLTEKYPMPGALTEYYTAVNSWRALPFSAGSLFYSVTAQMVQSMPMGVGVRASNKVNSVENFEFRLANITASATGEGDVVERYTINGNEIPFPLQIPESALRFGANNIEVVRGSSSDEFRLYSSTAQLLDYSYTGDQVTYSLFSTVPVNMVFENVNNREIRVVDHEGNAIEHNSSPVAKTNKQSITFKADGEFKVLCDR